MRVLAAAAVGFGLILSGLSMPAASASRENGVIITASGPKEIFVTTYGAGPRIHVDFTIKDRHSRARYFKTCMYNSLKDKFFGCMKVKLDPGKRFIKKTAAGWVFWNEYWYPKAVSPAICDAFNYHWPKTGAYIWVYDKDGEMLAEGKHGYRVKCLG